MTGPWKIYRPESGSNLWTNPVTGNAITGYTAMTAGGTCTWSTTHARFGTHSVDVLTTAGIADTGVKYKQTVTTTTGTHNSSLYYWSFTAQSIKFQLYDNTAASSLISTTVTVTAGRWTRLDMGTATVTTGHEYELRFLSPTTSQIEFWVTGIQLEPVAYMTSLIYGDRLGCQWTDIEHASTSTRSAVARLGGRAVDLEDTFGFRVQASPGAGHLPVTLRSDEYATLPGTYPQGVHADARSWALAGSIRGTTPADLHAKRDALLRVMTPLYPGDQDVLLVYTGGAADVQIRARYEGGLEFGKPMRKIERVNVKMFSDDPYVYEDNQEVATIDHSDSLTFNYIVRRTAGRWAAVDSGFSGGGSPKAYVVAVAPDGSVYAGGAFTTANATTVNNITRLINGAWTALGSGGTKGVDNIVYAIAVAPDGTAYFAGTFLNAGGSSAQYIVKYTPSTNAFTALGAGPDFGADGVVAALAIDPTTGYLIAAGDFSTIGGVSAGGIAYYNGSAWTSLASSGTGFLALAVTPNGRIYAGGSFSSVAGVTAAKIAYLDPGGTWTAMGSGANDTVYSLVIDRPTGLLYVGGKFTTLNGITCNRVGYYNGTSFVPLGSGLSGSSKVCYVVAPMPDGTLWAGGDFTGADDLTVAGLALWNGTRWVYPDFTATTPYVRGLAANRYGDLWMACDVTSGYVDGTTTVTNSGSAAARPILYTQPAATYTLKWLENTSFINLQQNGQAGPRLYLNLKPIASERVTIDPSRGSIASNWRPVGLGAMWLDGSQGTDFILRSGTNVIAAYSDNALGTEPLTLYWRVAHLGIDTQ